MMPPIKIYLDISIMETFFSHNNKQQQKYIP